MLSVRPSYRIFAFKQALWALFCAVPGCAFSQSPAPDSTSIVSYSDKLIIKLNSSTEADTYLYTDLQTGDRLDIRPNTELRLFLSVDYEFIGASLAFASGWMNSETDRRLKGKSSLSDYRFHFFLGRWVQAIHYRHVKGYYVQNTGDFAPGWRKGTDPYIVFPGLGYNTYGMSTAYVFNDRFSYRNVLYQTEWQKQSAGSFIPRLSYDYNRFSLVDEDIVSIEHNINLRVSPSYYYTWVVQKHWFLTATMAPSLGVRFTTSRETQAGAFSKEKDTYVTRFLEGGLQLGYSSERILFGANLNAYVNWLKKKNKESVENDQYYGVLYFGYRFDPPAFLRRTMARLQGK